MGRPAARSATDRATTEGADFTTAKRHNAVFGGVDGVVAADAGANATSFTKTDLADDNLTDFDFLPTKKFNAEALTW